MQQTIQTLLKDTVSELDWSGREHINADPILKMALFGKKEALSGLQELITDSIVDEDISTEAISHAQAFLKGLKLLDDVVVETQVYKESSNKKMEMTFCRSYPRRKLLRLIFDGDREMKYHYYKYTRNGFSPTYGILRLDLAYPKYFERVLGNFLRPSK